MPDTKLRLEAAAHETRCRECRVTWWSWLLRLLGRDEGYTPLPHLTVKRLQEKNARLYEALIPFATAHWRDVHPGHPAKDGGHFRPEDVEYAQRVFFEDVDER